MDIHLSPTVSTNPEDVEHDPRGVKPSERASRELSPGGSVVSSGLQYLDYACSRGDSV